MDLVRQSDQSFVSTKDYYFITKNYYFTTVSILVSAKQACYHYSDEKTNKFTYKTSKKLIYSHFYFYCGCSKIIMAIETEMFRLLFLCHERGEFDEIIYEREGTVNYVRE